jgi:hypothetical protein
MSFILKPSDFAKFANFYGRPDCREVVYRLYRKVCQGCRDNLADRDDYVTGHIIARRHRKQFEELFPGLEVDNLLNLHLLCQRCNVKQSAYHFESAFFLNQVFKESARAIDLRYSTVIEELQICAGSEVVSRALATQSPRVVKYFEELQEHLDAARLLLRRNRGIFITLNIDEAYDLLTLARQSLFDDGGRKVKAAESFYPWVIMTSESLEEGAEFSALQVFEALSKKEQKRVDSEILGGSFGVVRREDLRQLVKLAEQGIDARAKTLLGEQVDYVDTEKSIVAERLEALLWVNKPIWEPLVNKYFRSLSLEPAAGLLKSGKQEDGWLYWAESEFSELARELSKLWPDIPSTFAAIKRLAEDLRLCALPVALSTDDGGYYSTNSVFGEYLEAFDKPLNRGGRRGLWIADPQIAGLSQVPVSSCSFKDYAHLSRAVALLEQCLEVPDFLGRVNLRYSIERMVKSYIKKHNLRKMPSLVKGKLRGFDRILCVEAFEHYLINSFADLVEDPEIPFELSVASPLAFIFPRQVKGRLQALKPIAES